MQRKISGGCLCAAITFNLIEDFKLFYQCHCKQCQQLTGSAFTSNIFTAPNNIEWKTGADKIKHFEHPNRDFSKSFCSMCGSALPFVNKSQTSLIIPAGSLNDPFEIKPSANIFVSEKAAWLEHGYQAENFQLFPKS